MNWLKDNLGGLVILCGTLALIGLGLTILIIAVPFMVLLFPITLGIIALVIGYDALKRRRSRRGRWQHRHRHRGRRP